MLKAKNILIATGGAPSKLSIEGSEHAVTSDEALALDKLPEKSVLIVGSGCVDHRPADVIAAVRQRQRDSSKKRSEATVVRALMRQNMMDMLVLLLGTLHFPG